MRSGERVAAAGLFLFILNALAAGAEVQYKVTVLGPGIATALNHSGHVVGNYDGQAVLWSGGKTKLLYPGAATGINRSGRIVGSSNGHAVLWSKGKLTDLNSLLGADSWWTWTVATSINNRGQIVGYGPYRVPAERNQRSAYFYDKGVITPFGAYRYNMAMAINDRGQIAGMGGTQEHDRAVFYSNANIPSIDLDEPESYATGINNYGHVVGYAEFDVSYHAFLWHDGAETDLGTLGGVFSIAAGINDSGQVVGSSSISTEQLNAFLYSNGVMSNLNDLIDPSSGLTLIEATAINDRGQIVGFGDNGSGDPMAFLLTPAPEPPVLWLLVMGGLAILRRRSDGGVLT